MDRTRWKNKVKVFISKKKKETNKARWGGENLHVADLILVRRKKNHPVMLKQYKYMKVWMSISLGGQDQ